MSCACAGLSEPGAEGSIGLSLLVVLIYRKSVQPLQHVWELSRQYVCLGKIQAVLVPWQLTGGFSSAWGIQHCKSFPWQGLNALLCTPMSVGKGLCGEVRKVTGKPLVLLVYFDHAFQTEPRSQAFNLQVFHGELSVLIATLFTAREMQGLLLHAL